MKKKTPEKYQGFDLSDVCWGYRDIFARIIENLFERGSLGSHRKEVTEQFFSALKASDKQLFDHVLKSFLDAVAGGNAWIFDLPAIFEEVVRTGLQFAEVKLYYGIGYFRFLRDGGFGRTPQQVHYLITRLHRLMAIGTELAFAFLKGYKGLFDRLAPPEIDLYIREGIDVYVENRGSGCKFMEGALKSSENFIQSLTKEYRLPDIKASLEKLLKALAGFRVEISDLSRLDSDELMERGTHMVCLYKWLYLPLRSRYFNTRRKNRSWYMLQGIAAGGMYAFDSFPKIHGCPGFESGVDLAGSSILRQNLFLIMEYARVLRRIRKAWPGARHLIDFGIEAVFSEKAPQTAAERLFIDVLQEDASLQEDVSKKSSARQLSKNIDLSINVFDTVSLITDELAGATLKGYPGLDKYLLRSMGFLPDFFYHAAVSSPPKTNLAADMKDKAEKRAKTRKDKRSLKVFSDQLDASELTTGSGDNEEDSTETIQTCFVYDEWCQEENDYFPDYCQVYEKRFEKKFAIPITEEVYTEVKKVKKIFELIKPQLAHREKYLPEGETINEDVLLDYLVQRKKEPSPEIKYYEKPFIQKRDLAVLILLDISGSTGEPAEDKRVIDIEKNAALILGQGLAVLGDRFSICGFSSNGRENCSFLIFKDFDDPWNRESNSRLLSAWPMNSTRIGAALRHAGYKFLKVEARQRLIILITDGKPSDTAYDPVSRYAQHDVRMACEENKRKYIHTFCISTQENSIADMEIMFPDRRFAILKDIHQLINILPRLYIKMTA
jgi:nitric oxide reductase activation protein